MQNFVIHADGQVARDGDQLVAAGIGVEAALPGPGVLGIDVVPIRGGRVGERVGEDFHPLERWELVDHEQEPVAVRLLHGAFELHPFSEAIDDDRKDEAQQRAEALAAQLFEQPVTPLTIQLILEYGQQARRDALAEGMKLAAEEADMHVCDDPRFCHCSSRIYKAILDRLAREGR